MREDLKENFVLLSQVAKEKKYAQEYLGLLARRGDIGSLRIGKRWYTTWEWVEEFLENSQKKKIESVPAVEKAEAAQEEIRVSVPLVFPEREKVAVAQPAVGIRRGEKIFEKQGAVSVAVKTKMVETIGQRRTMGEIRRMGEISEAKEMKAQPTRGPVRNFPSFAKSQTLAQSPPRKISTEERNRHAVPYREMRMKKSDGVFSPDISRSGSLEAAFFPRFAFAASFAIIVCLAALSGYFAYTAGLFEKGQVAGASSASAQEFSSIQSQGEKLLSGAGEKIKEPLSVSRVVAEVAREKFEKMEQ